MSALIVTKKVYLDINKHTAFLSQFKYTLCMHLQGISIVLFLH